MKTFTQLISELNSVHSSYGRWGIMTLDGKLIDGIPHSTAETHIDFGVPYEARIDWAHEHPPLKGRMIDSSWGGGPFDGPVLNLRTTGCQTLATAIKYFNKFPHVAGRMVRWTHFERDAAGIEHAVVRDVLGQSIGILNKMKVFAQKGAC